MDNKKFESELNFRDLLKNPLRLFGWSFLYVFVLLVVVGMFFLSTVNSVSLNSTKPAIKPKTVVADIMMKKGGLMPAVNLDEVFKPTDELIAKGKESFDQICASCHGADGNGEGVAGAALNPKPRNFHESEGWTNGRNFGDIYKTLQEGIIANGMSPYEYLPVAERFAIIHYIRTFADFPPFSEDDLKELDLIYNLTEETYTPNQIPVELSMRRIAAENKEFVANIDSAIVGITNDESVGAQLLKSVSFDLRSVLASFKQTNTSYETFRSAAVTDAVTVGYSARIAELQEKDLRAVYDYLSGLSI